MKGTTVMKSVITKIREVAVSEMENYEWYG
jgi:hypothetical protein